MKPSFTRAESIFRDNNGILRNSQARELGINPNTLLQMVEAGLLVKEGRGLYRQADLSPLSSPDLVQVSLRVPYSVVCLISALAFHNLTTQIPYKIYIALPKDIKKPRLDYPPLDVIWLSKDSYSAGVVKHRLDAVKVRIYDREKTITDCFKFRKKIGQDVAVEALQEYMRGTNRDLQKLVEYARINRVEKIIRPYLEALL